MKPLSEVAQEADRFFMGKSRIHDAMRRICQTLAEMQIPYAMAGAMAVNSYGHHRTTADIDVLLNRDGLDAFKARWLGRGWVERFPGSKGMRDVVCNVKVDVLVSGEYPGDGKPKPVVFPDPVDVAIEGVDGLLVLSLPALIELKLASGMTAADRPRDLDDVIQLIRINGLSKEWVEQLAPYVEAKYEELWNAAQSPSGED